MRKYALPFVPLLLVPVAIVACSPAAETGDDDDDSSGAGGAKGGSGQQGGTGGGSSGNAGHAMGGTTPNPAGGAPATGGGVSTGGTGGGAPQGGSSGAAPQGGMGAVTMMGGTGNEAGASMVTCSNTDKSIIPIDSTGWVDKSCNACGIQGAFYWYADANTKASLMCNGAACVDKTAPFQSGAPGPGMCVSGVATGSADDWGAGIGLSLNDSGGMSSVKGAFNATTAACGNITGFDLTLTGNTGGMPVRVGFTTSGDGTTIAPFIPAGDPAGMTLNLSGSSQIVIKNAVIPADWMKTDPSPPDPASIYDMQIQIAADQAVAGTPFSLCVTNIKPVMEGGGGGGGGMGCKANSVGTISAATGVQALGASGLGFQNNVNNLGSGSQSVTGYYGSNCGALSVMTSGIKSNNNAPASYPSLVDGWHWGSWNGAYSQGSAKAVSALSTVKSSWAFTAPGGNKWDVAYDMWVASSTGIAQPDGSTLEVMVWLDYSSTMTTNPIGDKLTTAFSADGTSWEVWYGATGSWHTVTYRRTPGTAPVTDFDLLPFLKDAVTKGTGSASWNLLSVQAGFELFDASSGGSIDSYSCTIN